jgi:hypothetical protein
MIITFSNMTLLFCFENSQRKPKARHDSVKKLAQHADRVVSLHCPVLDNKLSPTNT